MNYIIVAVSIQYYRQGNLHNIVRFFKKFYRINNGYTNPCFIIVLYCILKICESTVVEQYA